MRKIIGVMGDGEKNIVPHLIDVILRDSEHCSRVILSEELEKGMLLDRDTIEKTEILIIEINKTSIRAMKESSIELDIIVDIDMTLDQSREYDYFNDKIKLVQTLKKNKLLIINTDYKHSMKLAYENQKVIIMTYGLNGRSSLTASSVSSDFDPKTKFNLCLQRTVETFYNTHLEPFEHPIEVNLIGMDNLYCVFAAIAVALHFNIDLQTIEKTFLMNLS